MPEHICPKCGSPLAEWPGQLVHCRQSKFGSWGAVNLKDFGESLCLEIQRDRLAVENERLRAAIETLRHEADQDWRCDGCERWFPAEIPPEDGWECDLCSSCVAKYAREKV